MPQCKSRLRFWEADDKTAEESADGIETMEDEEEDELGTAPDFFSFLTTSSMPLSDFSSCSSAATVAAQSACSPSPVSMAGLSDCGLGVGERLTLSWLGGAP